MKTLTVAFVLAFAALLTQPVEAQRTGGERYEEPSRFPVLRKAFRQIRSDLRYHAGALRSTASDIRHDIGSSIRGGTRPQARTENYYGYRGPDRFAARPPAFEDYYEEPPAPRRDRQATRRVPNPDLSRNENTEPKIVAPRNLPAPRTKEPEWMNRVDRSKRTPEPDPKLEPKHKSDPKPEPDPKTEPQREQKPTPEQKSKPKPATGKFGYPEAKRSNRPGFHYSPFAPYELLDTQGIEPGGLAKDPGNGKIFRIPK